MLGEASSFGTAEATGVRGGAEADGGGVAALPLLAFFLCFSSSFNRFFSSFSFFLSSLGVRGAATLDAFGVTSFVFEGVDVREVVELDALEAGGVGLPKGSETMPAA